MQTVKEEVLLLLFPFRWSHDRTQSSRPAPVFTASHSLHGYIHTGAHQSVLREASLLTCVFFGLVRSAEGGAQFQSLYQVCFHEYLFTALLWRQDEGGFIQQLGTVGGIFRSVYLLQVPRGGKKRENSILHQILQHLNNHPHCPCWGTDTLSLLQKTNKVLLYPHQ